MKLVIQVVTAAIILQIMGNLGAVEPNSTASDSTSPESGMVNETVRRALPYLKRAGETWIEKRQCVSCHQVPFMLWSLAAAEANGFDVDEKALSQAQAWSTELTSFVKPEKKVDLDENATMAANIDTMNGLLLAIDPSVDVSAPGNPDWRSRFTTALIENQNEDGSWKACGQLPAQKRPAVETSQVTTMWTLLALAQNKVTAKDRLAVDALIDNASPESTEWWVARLLLANEREEEDAKWRSELLARQNQDGGWGWRTEDESDALATGMALYAIIHTTPDMEANREVISTARSFLIETQRPDGSWAVPGTKKATRKKPTPTSNYWGTAWAVIGLLET